MAWTGRASFAAFRRALPAGVRRVAAPASVAVFAASWYGLQRRTDVHAAMLTDEDKTRHNVYTDHKLTKRELRFLEYASIEYDDVIYMSPMDFIDSLTRDAPRERVYRRVLSKAEKKRMVKKTPPLRKNSKDLFRKLDQSGLISYADYIFLVTLLTRSPEQFKIAFMMFDDDESGTVDKEEFILIRSLMTSLRSTRGMKQQQHDDPCQLDLSEFSFVVNHMHERLFIGADNSTIAFAKSEDEVKREDTTLLLHLFGLRGKEVLSIDDFMIFHDNLQRELVEIEFKEFARGKDHISNVDFAHLVLRYTVLNRNEYAEYIDRVTHRTSPDEEGISLAQWSSFSLFLNNLQQFATAVRLYTNADMPVSQAEFARAVQCTCGERLEDTVVGLIFAIFDANGDGKLSYREFLNVMNDRLHRGLKTRPDRGVSWAAFKACVLKEMNRP